MAAELLHAIMTLRRARAPDGQLTFTQPIEPILMPASARAGMGRDYDAIPVNTPPIFLQLVFWGGVAGERHEIAGTIVYPNNKTVPFQTAELIWPEGERTTHLYQIELLGAGDGSPLLFMASGVYWWKLLLDGEPLTELSLPIFWDDEFPGDITPRGA